MITATHTLAIVGCGKLKLHHPAAAADLYCGPLFRAARRWAEDNATAWLIASARHGLIRPDQLLAPYDQRMATGRDQARAWGFRCQADLSEYIRDHGRPDRVVVLAGRDYVQPLLNFTRLGNLHRGGCVDLPLAGLGIGQRLAWLAEQHQAALAVGWALAH